MGGKIKRAMKDVASVVTLGASNTAEQMLNPDMPSLPDAPELAPVADDEAISLANKRKQSKRRQGGRAGTILTEGTSLG